jgi:DNA invertase Pin-like site-specific DNA recombinase
LFNGSGHTDLLEVDPITFPWFDIKDNGDERQSLTVALNETSGDGERMKQTLHIYTRVSSTAQQEDGTSLESQNQLGVRKAVELGFDSRLWNEGGQSSAHDDLNNRPVLVSLLTLIESGIVKHLFVYNTDRLSRNQQTWAVIRYKLLQHGVTLHTASGQMKLKNPVDDLMLGILSEISQYDNRIRSERSRLGRFQKVQQGNWKGGPPPFGYRLANRRLEIDPFESEWVKRIYDWYCQGQSVKSIQAKLNQAGVLTRRGNKHWSLGSIQLILKNPVYVGYFDYCDKMVGETVRIPTPPIIDAHLFQIAQDKRRLIKDGKITSSTNKHFYLLRGIIKCGHCDQMMGGRTNKAGHQNLYYCVHKERDWKGRSGDHKKWSRDTGCSMKRSINIEKTNQLVWTEIKQALQLIQEKYPQGSDQQDSTHIDLDDRDRIPANGLCWITPEQADLLTEEEQKVVISQLLESITVHLDSSSQKHTLRVVFSESISQLLEAEKYVGRELVKIWETSREDLGAVTESSVSVLGGNSGKKLCGSGQAHAAEINYSVTVE